MHDVTYEDIDHRMGFHPADTDLKRQAHETVRALVMAATKAVCDIVPGGREKSLFITEMEAALQRANQALALNGGPKDHITVTHLSEILADFGSEYGRSTPLPDPAE